MGAVYLAEDSKLGRRVALKFLSAELERDETARRRLLREARSAAAIDHPYSCKIYEVDEVDGRSFIAMEYVEGRTLADILGDGPLGPDRARSVGLEIAEALEKAHEKGIVHRDLKPANVMLTGEGHVKVMDFGLAKPSPEPRPADEDEATLTALTRLGATPGTPAYMSPEQARGREADRRSDIFAFGILLHEMVSGRHPFLRRGTAETLAAILAEAPPPLPRSEAPEALRRVVDTALRKEPDDRYGSFAELRRDLEGKPDEGPGERSGVSRRLVVGVAIAVLVIVGLLLVSFLGGPTDERSDDVNPATGLPDVESLLVADHEAQALALMENFSSPTDLGLSIEAWQRVVDLQPDNASALAGVATARALVAWNSSPDPDVLELAESEARRAIEIDPGEAQAYVALSIVYQLEGLFDAAESMSDESMRLAPEDPWVLQIRARFLMDRYGEFRQGEELARRAVEIDPDHFPAWFQLGWAQYELERLTVAAESFRHSTQLRPDFGAGHLGLGMVLNAEGSFDEARRSFDRALEIDPDSVQALFLQGLSYHYLGDPSAAQRNFRSLIERNPQHLLTAHAMLCEAVELGALDREAEKLDALEVAEATLKAFPRVWWSLKGLAGVAALRGEQQEALAWLEQARRVGLYSVHQLLLDPSLDSLKGVPEFDRIVAETRAAWVERDLEAER